MGTKTEYADRIVYEFALPTGGSVSYTVWKDPTKLLVDIRMDTTSSTWQVMSDELESQL